MNKNLNFIDIQNPVNSSIYGDNRRPKISIINIKTNEYCYKIKVHKQLICTILKNREKKLKYQTNTEIKYLSLYYQLKAVTQTGIIQNYYNHLPELLDFTGLSQGTFYKQLGVLIKFGLVEKNAQNLVIASFKTLFEVYGVEDTQTPIYINYNPKTHKFLHLLEFSTLADNMFRQSLTIKRKLEKSPYTLEILQRYAKQQTTVKTLQTAQKHAFVNGSDELNTLFFINPSIVITWKKIFREYNFKSYKSVSYLKKKLQRNKIITIDKQGFFTSKVGAKTKVFCEEKDKTVNTCRYNKTINKTQKQFADNWILTPELYAFTPYYKN